MGSGWCHGIADRAHGQRPAQLGSDPRVRSHLAARNLEDLEQDLALEVGQLIEFEAHPRGVRGMSPQPCVDDPLDKRRRVLRAVHRPAESCVECLLEAAGVAHGINPLDERDAAPAVGHEKRSDRAIDPHVLVVLRETHGLQDRLVQASRRRLPQAGEATYNIRSSASASTAAAAREVVMKLPPARPPRIVLRRTRRAAAPFRDGRPI